VSIESFVGSIILAAAYPVVELTKAELDALPEYSCTEPTGVVMGKRWKHNVHFGKRNGQPPAWLMGEYSQGSRPDTYLTRYFRVELRA